MQWRLRLFPTVLVLLLSGACTDAPTGPSLDPGAVGPSRIGVWAPGGGGKCDPWQDVNWCEGDSGGEPCITGEPLTGGEPEEYVGVQGCGTGGGGPGGDGGDDDGEEPPPADTCRTGDPALDSPAVKQGLKDLWARSNPTLAQAQRLEQAAWILQNPDGTFRMATFSVTVQGPCGVNGNLNAPPGAVAWVHTHPFTRNEVQTICGALKQPDPTAPGGYRDVLGPNGQPVYPVYRNLPSIPDRELLQDMNDAMTLVGRDQLSGVIIDANQTTVYSENPGDGTTSFPRCVY